MKISMALAVAATAGAMLTTPMTVNATPEQDLKQFRQYFHQLFPGKRAAVVSVQGH